MKLSRTVTAATITIGSLVGLGGLAFAQGGSDPTTEDPNRRSGEDVRGPCDEAEHVGDPRCAGVVVTTTSVPPGPTSSVAPSTTVVLDVAPSAVAPSATGSPVTSDDRDDDHFDDDDDFDDQFDDDQFDDDEFDDDHDDSGDDDSGHDDHDDDDSGHDDSGHDDHDDDHRDR